MTTSRGVGEDLLHILDEFDELISNTQSVPMSALAIVSREDALHLINRARDAVPSAVRHTEEIVADADAVLTGRRTESGRLVQYAQEESERLATGENIVRMANDQADSITAAAEDKAASLRHGADGYSDRTLASLEAGVVKAVGQIRTNREVLAGRLGDDADQPMEIQEPVCHRSGWSVDPSAY